MNKFVSDGEQIIIAEHRSFVDAAQRTASPQFNKLTRIEQDYFITALRSAIQMGNVLDQFKKKIFYNKPFKGELQENIDVWTRLDSIVNQDDVISEEVIPVKLFHGLLGIYTESVELLEILLKAIEESQDIDKVNLLEELGDIKWYESEIWTWLWDNNHDTTELDCRNAVIAKLKARYPEKFASNSAIERDLFSEREILENNLGQTNANTTDKSV